MKTIFRFWLTLLLLIPATAMAAKTQVPKALRHFVDGGAQVVRRFDAPSGLTGYVIKVRGRQGIVYVTRDGAHALVGTLINASGENLTAQEARRYFSKPDLSAAWKQLQNATWVAEGSRQPKTIIYEFTDPNCPFCHLFWLANRQYFKEGLQVRHILVGFLSHSSQLKAAAILESPDPAAAYRRNEAHYRTGVEESHAGAIAPDRHPRPSTLKKIEANTALMSKLGVNGTPGVFYKDAQGKVHRIVGLPPLGQLPKMYGLPAQKLTDPALKPYL